MKETNTYKKLKGKARDNFPECIVVHHSGGTQSDPLADTSHHTATVMETGHLSLGWEGLGYHYVIHKDGEVWKGRPEHYHGAHVKEDDMNTKSIGICLAGNFDVTLPTKEQELSLIDLIKDIRSRANLTVYPHRYFLGNPPYKSCYGKRLTDEWIKNLLKPVVIEDKKVRLKSNLLRILEELKNAVLELLGL